VLGYYTNADQYSSMPSTTISAITNKVSYPVFSEIQADDARLRQNARKLTINIMFISFVVMFGLAAMAKPLFGVVLGEKWLPSAGIFQALCIAYAISPLHVINQNIMKARGRSDLFLKTEVIKYIIFTPLLITGAIMGIEILIAGIIVFYWVGYVVIAAYSKKLAGYSIGNQVSDFLPVMLIALFPAIITWLISNFLNISLLFQLPLLILVYPSLVILLSVLVRLQAYYEIKNILADKLTVSNFMKTFNLD
jgi:O-antigen/teichoic acid export membrane protein